MQLNVLGVFVCFCFVLFRATYLFTSSLSSELVAKYNFLLPIQTSHSEIMYIFENSNIKYYIQSSCISSLWFQLIIIALMSSTLLAYRMSSHLETHNSVLCPKIFIFTVLSALKTLSNTTPPNTHLLNSLQLAC